MRRQIVDGKPITLMVDYSEHVERSNGIAMQPEVALPLRMDVNMSTRFFGLRCGVCRSPLRSAADAVQLLDTIKGFTYPEKLGSPRTKERAGSWPQQ